jgi:hypothetical protein
LVIGKREVLVKKKRLVKGRDWHICLSSRDAPRGNSLHIRSSRGIFPSSPLQSALPQEPRELLPIKKWLSLSLKRLFGNSVEKTCLTAL